MLDSFEDAIGQIPHGTIVAALAGAVVLLQVVALVVAWKRRAAPILRLHVASGLTILILPVLAGVCVHTARAMMFSAVGGSDPSEKATTFSAGLSGQLNTIPFITTTLLFALPLWFVGFAIAREARRASQGRAWPAAALLALALPALAVGVLQWSIFMIHMFASMAGMEPVAKVVLARKALDFSRGHLALFALTFRITVVGLAVIAAVLAVAGGGTMKVRAARRRGLVSLAAAAFAGVLFLAARPMRAENELPWPPSPNGEELMSVDPPTPELTAPDPIERAPVVQVFLDKVALDGMRCEDLDDLEGKLVTLRTNHQLLHPGESFNGRAVIVADGAASANALEAVLEKLHAAEYLHPEFAFTKAETLVRPMIGTLHRVVGSAICATIIDRFDVEAAHDPRGGEDGTLVRARDFARYDPLARQMLAVRQSGSAVVLKVGK
jgi:hypothetical protein